MFVVVASLLNFAFGGKGTIHTILKNKKRRGEINNTEETLFCIIENIHVVLQNAIMFSTVKFDIVI